MVEAEKSPWAHALSAKETDRKFERYASFAPSMAVDVRAFYETRTEGQLELLAAQAWRCSEAEDYQLARSFLAIKRSGRGACT